MLIPAKSKNLRARDGFFAIVASQYNAQYVDSMLRAAKVELQRGGAKSTEVFRVPGAFEIPVVAARLARAGQSESSAFTAAPLSAIICLGVILRGQTVHAAHIGEAVSRALMQIQLRYEIPV